MNSSGTVNLVAAGETVIEVKSDNNEYMGQVPVKVVSSSNYVPTTGISLNKSTVSLKYSFSSSARLKATITPSNATNKTVTWISSDPTAFSCTDGYLKCLETKEGTFTVTARAADGQTATCAVTITRTGTVVNSVSPTEIELDTYDATSCPILIKTTDYAGYNSGYTVFANDAAIKATDQTSSGFTLNIPKNTGGTRTIEVYVHGNFSGWDVDDPETFHTIKVTQPYNPLPLGWGNHCQIRMTRELPSGKTEAYYIVPQTYFLAIGGTAYRHVYDPDSGKGISGDAQIQIRCAAEAWDSIFKGTTVSASWIHISKQSTVGYYLVSVDENNTGVAREGQVNIGSGLVYEIHQDA